MTYATEAILGDLKAAREERGLSQRDLSAKVGVPQSHISKIESGGSDLRLSSLVELARALDLELVLVPRKFVPAVEAIVRNASSTPSGDVRQRLAVLRRTRTVLSKLSGTDPELPGLKPLEQTLRELGNFQLGPNDLATIRSATDRLAKIQSGPDGVAAVRSAGQQLRDLRNRIVHAIPETPRPAYSLDGEDNDA